MGGMLIDCIKYIPVTPNTSNHDRDRGHAKRLTLSRYDVFHVYHLSFDAY